MNIPRLKRLFWFESLGYRRNIYQALLPAFFFLMALALHGLAGDGQPPAFDALYRYAWVILLLATLLNTDRIWGSDGEDGTLTQWYLLPVELLEVLAAKSICYWFFSILPPILVMCAGIWLETGNGGIWQLLPVLLIGTVTSTSLAMLAATMQLLARKRQGSASLILLPFFIPILIFGANGHVKPWEVLAYQAGLLLVIAPLAILASLQLLKLQRGE